MVPIIHLSVIFTLFVSFIATVTSLPVVDKGVFVITGVKTCGEGSGYCVLGGDCTVDKEFAADTNGGHCDGLRKAFTPRAYFVCCEYVDANKQPTTSSTTPVTTTSTTAGPESEESPEQNSSAESKESSTSAESPEIPESDEAVTVGGNQGQVAVTTTASVNTEATVGISSTLKPGTTIIIDTGNNALVLDESTVPAVPEKPIESSTLDSQRNDIEEDTIKKIEATTTTDSVINEALNDGLETKVSSISQTAQVPLEQTTENVPVTQAINTTPAETTIKPADTSSSSVISSSATVPTTSVEGLLRDKESSSTSSPIPPTTTVISYSEKTEISVEQSVSLHVKQCGVKLFSSRFDSPRLAAQGSSGSPSSCWTGAVVRSPSTLTMQADLGSFLCAGALIHPSVFLTTATCVSRMFSQDLSLFKIALGSGHLVHPANGPTADADYRDIRELVIHEDYVVDGHLRINDIALVMLSEPADMTKTCTLCLPEENSDFTGRECVVTGYSHPSDSSGLESDGILHEADQRIEYQGTCETVLTNFTQHSFRTEKDLQGLLCASGKYSAEACFSPRDAGSPLACSQNGVYVLAGSFSSGFHCGTPDMPVLYTDITRQISWVNKNLLKTFVAF